MILPSGYKNDCKIIFSKEENNDINKKIMNHIEQLKGKNQSIEYWKENRNARAEKAEHDIFLGKKGEFFVAKFLNETFNFPKEVIPDLTIYNGNFKNWQADLAYNSFDLNFPDVHVKTCDDTIIRIAGQPSWTFQLKNNSNNYGRDQILDLKKIDLVVLCYIPYVYGNVGRIMVLIPSNKIKKYLKPPVVERLKDLKACLYWNDLNKKQKGISY